jgi:subtilisin-like proprotein convertase family protein
MNIKFDSYPEDLELELTNDGTKYVVWSRNDALHKYTAADQQSTVTTSACLPANGCWRLTVIDTKGDGYVTRF